MEEVDMVGRAWDVLEVANETTASALARKHGGLSYWARRGETIVVAIDLLYDATKAVFGFLTLFDADWQEGYRPLLDVTRPSADGRYDIMFLGPLGSYVRLRASEHGDEPGFARLHAMCEARGLTVKGKHGIYAAPPVTV